MLTDAMRRTFREQGYVAGSLLFAHYLLAHNIGGHDGPAHAAWRRTLYYRLSTVGHSERWRTIVTEPLREFR
jgi:ketosteroid isomerase-like protein